MAERITVELVRANRGERVLADAGGNDIDAALAAFEAALDDVDGRPGGQVFVRAVLGLDRGDAGIKGDPARTVEGALDNFSATRQQYSAGPGWGGPG